MRIIYRIYSENPKVENYIDYEPEKSHWVSPVDRRGYIGLLSREQLFEMSGCVTSGFKESKSFIEIPEGARVIGYAIKKDKRKDTLVTSEYVDCDFDLYLDLEIVERIDAAGKVRYILTAQDGGVGKSRQRESADRVIAERNLNESNIRRAYSLNRAIANSGKDWAETRKKQNEDDLNM